MNKESYRSVQKLHRIQKESLKAIPLWKSAVEMESFSVGENILNIKYGQIVISCPY